MRNRIKTALHKAMKNKEKLRISTLRMMMSTIVDGDITMRTSNLPLLSDKDIVLLLTVMIKSRNASADLYAQADRISQRDQELAEIEIINEFLPVQLTTEEIDDAIGNAMNELEIKSIKDMGKIMAFMKDRYFGKINMADVAKTIRARLAEV